tara:strand:- start:303 stop:470 length:168 start_codon:yes stop_codon:yes gene_type:complete
MKPLFEIKVKSMKIDVSIIREIIGKTVIASVTIAEKYKPGTIVKNNRFGIFVGPG